MSNKRGLRNSLISLLGILSLWFTSGANLGNAQVQAQAAIDVSIEISSSANTVKPGEIITYTITARNLGPTDATLIDVAVSVPDQLTIVSITCDYGISPDGPFCEYSSLLAGARAVSTFVVTPNSSTLHGNRMLKIGASVLFENPDPFDTNMSNNAAWVKTKLIGNASHP